LGPDGIDSLRKNVPRNTLDGYLKAARGGEIPEWQPHRVSRPDHGGSDWSYTLLMSSLHLYGDDSAQPDAPSTLSDRAQYRSAIQGLFEAIRERREWDYVLVDTRGGFAMDTVEICAVADSFILVTEPNTTNFYQDKNLFGHIAKSAVAAKTRPALRGVLVNKAANFPEPDYSGLVRRAFELDPEDIFTIPIDPEAIAVYQQQQAIYVAAAGSAFATTTFRAFASMFGVVTAPWTPTQITAWQNLAKRLSAASQEKLKRLRWEGYRRRAVLGACVVAMIAVVGGTWGWGQRTAVKLSREVDMLNREYRKQAEENSVLNARLLALAEKGGDAAALARQLVEAQKATDALRTTLKQRDDEMTGLKNEIEELRAGTDHPSASPGKSAAANSSREQQRIEGSQQPQPVETRMPTFTKTGSDATIESLRSFQLAFIDKFAVPGKKFNAAEFNAKVNEGNSKFQQAIADEKFTARRPVLVDLKAQFDADAAHLKSKASRGKITPALASEMKKDVNKIYDHARGQ
jgi:hypothetical protein